MAVWLKLLKADDRAIFIASSKASRAVRYLRERVDIRLKQLTAEGS